MPEGKSYYGIGYNEFANMPQEKICTEFPRSQEALNVNLDDTAKGIDGAKEATSKYLNSHLPKGKY